MATDTYQAVGGGIAAAVNAPWATQSQSRRATDWVPNRNTPVVRADGTLTDQWYRFASELARRAGGPQGKSIPEIDASISATQAQATAALTAAESAAQLAQSADIAIDVIREVAINAGLSGAGEIP